ncbi:hypothetical protein GOBAR_AA10567 [Gossypium barbadense]|uniref:Uncharacterized protein n=1 Tax=Gossypium barbadense TaxID=3634 RepID=A0A2P5Y3G1_GOSBA|nr:hypothetical protein GOBAR_AA10567 [Gossypium barbadense]
MLLVLSPGWHLPCGATLFNFSFDRPPHKVCGLCSAQRTRGLLRYGMGCPDFWDCRRRAALEIQGCGVAFGMRYTSGRKGAIVCVWLYGLSATATPRVWPDLVCVAPRMATPL